MNCCFLRSQSAKMLTSCTGAFVWWCCAVQVLSAQPSSANSQPSVRSFSSPAPVRSTSATTGKDRLRFGVFGGVNYNQHDANFVTFEGLFRNPDAFLTPPTFTSTNFLSWTAGVSVEIPLLPWLRLGIRGNYAINSATFVAPDSLFTLLAPLYLDGAFRPTEHRLETVLSSIGIEPVAMIRPVGGLFIALGVRGAYMLQRSYTHAERSLSSDVVFENGARERNRAQGELPAPSLPFLSAVGSVGYDIPVASGDFGKLFLTPEVSVLYGLTPVERNLRDYVFDTPTATRPREVASGTWNLHQFRAVLGIKYELPQPERYEYRDVVDTVPVQRRIAKGPSRIRLAGNLTITRDTLWDGAVRVIRETRRRADTLVSRQPDIKGSVTVAGVTEKGAEMPVAEIRVEEFLGYRYLPLLNYVFFDENSSDIPERYTRLGADDAEKFTVEQLYRYEPMPAYREILNIVGRRMLRFPEAKLTLTGCNANLGSEKANTTLSFRRAMAVREYLMSSWGLDSTRIIVKSRNLSENPSVPITEPDKIEENRRVEITSDVPEITEWIVTPDTLRIASPPIARFRLNAQAEAGVKQWRLLVEQNGNILRTFNGDGDPPTSVDWQFMKEVQEKGVRVNTEVPFIYTPYITDNTGQIFEGESVNLPLHEITIQRKRTERRKDKEFEQFSLILFDFDKAQLGAIHKRTAEFVKSRTKPNSEVEILGYTDRTGSAEYNRRLSEQRARQIANVVNVPNMTVRGVGKDDLLYDNEFPEGRYYCRTVTVTIETPIEN